MAKMRSTIQSLDNLFSSFKKEYKTIVGSLHPYHAFTVFCAKYFYFSDSSNDIDDDFLKCLPDGKNDGGIDAVFINPMEDTNELVILQGKYYKKTTLGLQPFKDELNKIIDTIKALNNHKSGSLNDNVKAAYASAIDELEEGFSVRIDICTSNKVTSSQQKKFQKVCDDKSKESGFNIRFLCHDDILRQVISCIAASDTVDEYTLAVDEPGNVLRHDGSIIVNVSAQSLRQLYMAKRERVLGRNLRYHIKGNKQAKDVDGGIRKTIEEEPMNFWYFNNGILIACEKYSLDGNVLKLRKFSIVNGGQTTYNIASIEDLSTNFFVQCKVVVAKGETEAERNRFCLQISNATNSQKPIKPSDLRANKHEQHLLKDRLKNFGFYYVTKAGEKPQNRKIFKNYQIANLDKVGKIALAGVLMMPGTSRSSPSKMFDQEIYDAIFVNSLPGVFCDLLTLAYHYGTFKRNAINNPEKYGFSEEHLQIIRNGERFYLACIGYMAKIKAKAFTHQDVMTAKKQGDDKLRECLWNHGNLNRIIVASGDVYPIAEHVFRVLTKRVLWECCKTEKKALSGNGSFVYSNYFKKDTTFTKDIVEVLWTMYNDSDEPVKKHIDNLIGENN